MFLSMVSGMTGALSASIERLHLRLKAAGGELVSVVDDQAKLGRILRVDAARILRWDDDSGVDFAGADILRAVTSSE